MIDDILHGAGSDDPNHEMNRRGGRPLKANLSLFSVFLKNIIPP